jgi:flagellar motor switch protein FliN/FliY
MEGKSNVSEEETEKKIESTEDAEVENTATDLEQEDSIKKPSGSQKEEKNELPDIPPLPDFTGMLEQAAAGSIELLKDVELTVKIELGRSEMAVNEILSLTNGSVVELDKLAGDPVDVFANEQLIARGEVLVLNDNFCVRINEIIPGVTERAAKA